MEMNKEFRYYLKIINYKGKAMDLLCRVPSFNDIEEALEYFEYDITLQDNYFYASKNFKNLEKNDTIYFIYENKIISKGIYTGDSHIDKERDNKFIYGYKLKNIKIINSINTIDKKKIPFHDLKYINSVSLYDIVKDLLIENEEDSMINDLNNIYNDTKTNTEIQRDLTTRLGQGKFREKLVNYWQGCAITNCEMIDILIASHIKPWSKSDNNERLDVYNGLLLLPNLDKLFDKGYISFNDNGEILISSKIENYEVLGINKTMKINIEKEHSKYLKYHRDNIFIN